MANLDDAMGFVLDWEGGFSNDPNDPGGRTKFGLSERYHPEAWEHGAPSLETARKIYRDKYWKPSGAHEIASDKIATAVFDSAVNFGVSQGVQFLQRACGLNGHGIAVDGRWGPNTKAATHAVAEDRLLKTIVALRARYRIRRVNQRPSQQKFLYGWLNRDFSLLDQ